MPRDVCVTSRADVGAGHVDVLGREGDGVNVDFEDSRTRGPGVRGSWWTRMWASASSPCVTTESASTTTMGPSTGNPMATGPASRAMHRPDLPSLVSGIALIALGTVLLFDRLEMIDIGFGVFGPLLFAALGAMFLARGLSRRA